MKSEQQQPKDPADVLFICSLEDLNCLHDYIVAAMAGDDLSEIPRLWNQQIGVIRSHPHPAPQAPERYTGVCAIQDKCMDYSDFIESIMDELDDPDADDPPCPIKCDKRVNPNQADCNESAEQARKKERERVLGIPNEIKITQSLLYEFCEYFCGFNCEDAPCPITVSRLHERLIGIETQMKEHPEYLKKWKEKRDVVGTMMNPKESLREGAK